MVHFLFGFDDPRSNPRKKATLDSMDPTHYMIEAQKEASRYGLFYQVLQPDEDAMAFEYQKKLNPSSYILRIDYVFRVWHSEQKKEFLYYYASEQVRGMPRAETIPGKETQHRSTFLIHPKPNIQAEGYDYKGNPINIRVLSTEWVFEQEWDPKVLDSILANPDNKFSGTKFYVGTAPLDTSRPHPSPKFQVKNYEDFKQGNIFDLMEMAQSRTEFTNLAEFQETKEAQKKARADLTVKTSSKRPSSPTREGGGGSP